MDTMKLNSDFIRIKKSDLKKLVFIQAEKMEQFIRDKGLYEEFYNNYVLPDIKFDIIFDTVSTVTYKDFITGEFQRKHPLPDKSYNEYIQENFNAK